MYGLLEGIQVDVNIAAIMTAVGAISAAMGAYLADRRLKSGKIESSEAHDLWAAAGHLREDLFNELHALRQRLVDVEEENTTLKVELATLRIENAELKRRNEQLTDKATRLESKMTELERHAQRQIDQSDTGGTG